MTYIIQAISNQNSQHIVSQTRTDDKTIMDTVRKQYLSLGFGKVVVKIEEGER